MPKSFATIKVRYNLSHILLQCWLHDKQNKTPDWTKILQEDIQKGRLNSRPVCGRSNSMWEGVREHRKTPRLRAEPTGIASQVRMTSAMLDKEEHYCLQYTKEAIHKTSQHSHNVPLQPQNGTLNIKSYIHKYRVTTL